MAARKKRVANKEIDIVESNKAILEKKMNAFSTKCNKMFNSTNPTSFMLASDLAEMEETEPLPTRHISFDLMTGIGGLPRGRIIEFTGEEGSNKSNVAWLCIGAVHQANPNAYCVWIDAEKAVDFRSVKQRRHILNMGVDFERLFVYVPQTAEDCWRLIAEASDSGAELIVLDSISALVPKKEYDLDFEKGSGYPALPAAINAGFRKVSTKLFFSGATLIEISQVRENLEVAGQKYVRFEDKWKTTGGKGKLHWLMLRLFFRRKKIWTGESPNKQYIGDEVFISIIKTRLAPVTEAAHMFMYHKSGFDKYEELVTLAVAWEILYKEKKTSRSLYWAGYEDSMDAMSWNEWYEYFKTEPEAYDMMYNQITEIHNDYYSKDEDAEIDEDLAEQEADYYDEEEEE